MIKWLLKSLWQQKVSVLSSSLGVAFAFVLVVIIEAAFVGESNQIVSYLRNVKADIWVLQKGVSNMHMATTFVSDWKSERIASLPGVKKTTPILYVNTAINSGGRNWFAYVIGLMPDDNRAGPWSIAQGKSQPGQGEILLPQVLADMTATKLGDKASIADMDFIVSGFTQGTFSMANSIAFVDFRDLEDLISVSGTVSFILVDLESGLDKLTVAKMIEDQIDKVSAIPHEQFIKNDFQIALLMGVEVVSFMSIIGTVLAALIIAFAAYSQVNMRKKELAIARALGYRKHSLYAAVLIQTFIITGLALILALFFAFFIIPVLSTLAPQITLSVTTAALLRLSVIAFIVALVAALIPARIISNLDPVSVFRS